MPGTVNSWAARSWHPTEAEQPSVSVISVAKCAATNVAGDRLVGASNVAP
jgi:hypothetical protein